MAEFSSKWMKKITLYMSDAQLTLSRKKIKQTHIQKHHNMLLSWKTKRNYWKQQRKTTHHLQWTHNKINNWSLITNNNVKKARILYPREVCFKNEDEVKTFPKAKTERIHC